MSSPEVAKDTPPYEPSTTLRMTKMQAGSLSIGSRVTVSVKGSVVGIRQCYDDKDQYDVELKPSAVSNISTANLADKSYKKLAKGDKSE